jgi:hypothetical protein
MTIEDHTRTNFSATFEYLVSEVRSAVLGDTEIIARPKRGVIAWRLGEERFYFYLGAYNEIIYRLKIRAALERSDLPDHFWRITVKPGVHTNVLAFPQHWTELSFHHSEVSSVKGSDLVRFVQDCFRCAGKEDVYPWPLFFQSGQWKQHYAWTVLGKIEQTKRETEHHLEVAL